MTREAGATILSAFSACLTAEINGVAAILSAAAALLTAIALYRKSAKKE